MQEILTDRARRFHFQAVDRGQCIHADHLYDLLQLCLFLQKAHKTLAAAHPLIRYILIKPFSQIVHIQGITGQPVDRREMALVCQR